MGRVRAKSVYDPPSSGDGVRVLVTRYWPRGVKKDLVHEWARKVSTPAELIKEFKAGGLGWAGFSKRYSAHLKSRDGAEGLAELKALVKASGTKGVTLLCSCRDTQRCHTAILKDLL